MKAAREPTELPWSQGWTKQPCSGACGVDCQGQTEALGEAQRGLQQVRLLGWDKPVSESSVRAKSQTKDSPVADFKQQGPAERLVTKR